MKTADEMFAELGYSKNIEGDYASAASGISISISPDKTIFIEDSFNQEICLLFDEILACAQLIKEMEEE